VPEATVSFAGNLTADPEVRYTESGLQGDDEIGPYFTL
jgi:single-stranded DNA-binding protein